MYRILRLSVLLWGLAPFNVTAEDFGQEPYLIRLLLAFDRSGNYANTIASEITLGLLSDLPDKSASSSAIDETDIEPGQKLILASTNGVSNSDAWITAMHAITTFTDGYGGVWIPAYGYTKMIYKNNKEDLANDLKLNEFFIGYSKLLTNSLSFGIQTRLFPASIVQETNEFGRVDIIRASVAMSL